MSLLRDAPRWVLVAALLLAPWFYGSTTEQGIVLTTWIVAAAVILWLVGLPLRFLSEWSKPAVRTTLWLVSLALLGFGWFMALNSHTIYDADLAEFVPIRNPAGDFPGSLDQAISVAWMFRATALLGAVCLVADASRNPVWFGRFCLTSAATGGSIALLGLVEKATHAPMIFWHTVDQPVTTFFATFFYHGNAAAFLNLTLPLTIGLAYRSFLRRQRPFARAVWSTAAFTNATAVFANTSRMGHILGLGILVILGLIFVRKKRLPINWSIAAIGCVALALALYALTQTMQIERSVQRWEEASGSISVDARWLSSRIALRALPEAGWFGFGPGTFHVVFPYYTAGVGERLNGFWHYLHEDYLQTLLEWGLIGSALWAFAFFGGIAVALRARFSKSAGKWRPRQRILLPLIVLGLASVAIHALVDFPFRIASIQLYGATYLGMCWSASRWHLTTDE